VNTEELIFIQNAIDKLKEIGVKPPYFKLEKDGTITEIYSE